ncbi:hypothetical protein ACFTWR_16810 [Streptomyces nigra]|uniref:hypothetical protein n=1 Tax=Streptomyces nigra TaxID=1827580 RepID=UPI00362E7DD9
MLTGLDQDSTYAAHVLPPLLLLGVGLGLVMPPAMSLGITGVAFHDAAAAGAAVNTRQWVGGAIGTALLNTLAAAATGAYLTEHARTPAHLAQAQLHRYATAYGWSASLFAAGAVVAAPHFRRGRPAAAPQGAAAVHL